MADITTSRIVYNNEGPPIQANGFIRIDSSGGTDNYYLELYEAGAQRFRIYENSNNVYFDGGPGNTIFRPRQGGGTNNFFITGADVGIGTTSTEGKLTVVGATQTVVADLAANASVGLSVMGMPTNNFNAITVGSANSTNNSAVWRFKYNGAGSTNNYFGLGFYGNDDILNVKANGRVGINQITPESELHIEGNGGDGLAMLRMIATGSGTFNWMSSTVYSNLGIGNTCIHLFGKEQASKNQGYIGFTFAGDHSDDNRVTIGMYASDYLFNVFADGRVGIGVTAPGHKLDVNGDAKFISNSSSRVLTLLQQGNNNGNIIQFQNHNGGNVWELVGRNNQFYIYNNALSAHALFINPSNSNIGIGNTSPSQKLHVTGSVLASSDVVAFSDIKLKENIKTLDGSKVYDMRGVSFTRKDTGKNSSGVIAQEIQKIAPELVTDNDGTLSVAYGNLTGYLIEAVKELKTEVKQLKKQIKNGNNL